MKPTEKSLHLLPGILEFGNLGNLSYQVQPPWDVYCSSFLGHQPA